MTRARELAKLANSNVFSVDSNNNVGINSSTPDTKLDVVGVISATSFSGGGSNLTGIIAGATLNASSGTQRLVVTSQTTGSMTQAATSSDITYNTSTSTLSATQYSGNLSGNATGLQGTPSITVQDITAEQISAAGTVTYARVENVNSVGIITANKGIKVPNYGVNVTGVITATSFQGDGSGLTGVESGTQSFVASGTIPNGATVVINTDGTVSTITQTTVGPTPGSVATFQSGSTTPDEATYDTNSNKVVIFYNYYNGSSSVGTAVVGTVSGTSISFGTPVAFESAGASYGSIVFDSNSNKVVISYVTGASGNAGTSIVGTVSGTSISFGSKSIFSSSQPGFEVASTFDSVNNKIINCYKDNGNSSYGTAVVGTVSGTSISWGSAVVFQSSTTQSGNGQFAPLFDPDSGKVIIVYGAGGQGKVVVGTVSGTSISFGSVVTFNSGATGPVSSTYDSTSDKVVIAYRNQGNSNYGTAIVGTVSGTSISFGTAVVFNTANSNYISSTYDVDNNNVLILYNSSGIKSNVGTVSGTSISFGPKVSVSLPTSSIVASTYDPDNGRVVVPYRDDGDNNGKAVVLSPQSQTTNLTAENYIGIAAGAIANGATGKITVVGGTNSGQSSLTVAQKYFVQPNGTLATSAGTPSVVAGTSVSSTKIAVQKS